MAHEAKTKNSSVAARIRSVRNQRERPSNSGAVGNCCNRTEFIEGTHVASRDQPPCPGTRPHPAAESELVRRNYVLATRSPFLWRTPIRLHVNWPAVGLPDSRPSCSIPPDDAARSWQHRAARTQIG